MDDWWDVDEKAGVARGHAPGNGIGIGDVAKVRIVRVDVARRELDLRIEEVVGRARAAPPPSHRASRQGRKRRRATKRSSAPRRRQKAARPEWPQAHPPLTWPREYSHRHSIAHRKLRVA